MSDTEPLTFGIRQAIRRSSKTPYQISKLASVSAPSLYRFIHNGQNLSQAALDRLGRTLELGLTLDYDPFRPSHLVPYLPKKAGDLDKIINEIPDSTLSQRIRRTAELHRWTVAEFADRLTVTKTQFYRFLDGSRGLSQAKLDSLTDLLGLFVQGPFAALPPLRKGGMITGERPVYRPPAARNLSSS